MGKRGSQKRLPNRSGGAQGSITLREESIGKKQSNVNPKSILKLEHIKNPAVWSTNEASIPSLGAFFGHRLAACGDSIGVPPDPSLFTCQRCESILLPGHNCTVRIEKNGTNPKGRHKKPINPTQNNVVYNCHFCLHRNLKRGTPRGHMKEICPPKVKPSPKLPSANPTIQKCVNSEKNVTSSTIEVKKIHEGSSKAVAVDDSITSSPAPATPLVKTDSLHECSLQAIAADDSITSSPAPATPLVKTYSSLLDVKKRKRNKPGTKKSDESESNSVKIGTEKAPSTSSKRKRKSWTSLKEIAASSEHDRSRKLNDLTVPFFI